MGKAPTRSKQVFILGAGVSAALGLLTTRELLHRVHALAQQRLFWGLTRNLATRLERAYRFLYPESAGVGFRPDAVDFFSLLKAYVEIGSGHPGGLSDSNALLTDLKFALANALVQDLREVDNRLSDQHTALSLILTPGNVVITLNWDILIERYCDLHRIPVRLDGDSHTDEVLILKLHGSIDWTLRSNAKKTIDMTNYSVLRERLFDDRQYTIPIRGDDTILRTRAVEQWSDSWRKLKSRTTSPFIVTMSQGKQNDLVEIEPIWLSAYNALSAAKCVEIVGYSMPPDDVEVRALLRAGIARGASSPDVIVRNPAPDVHDRIRSYVDRKVKSNYIPFPGYHG